MLESCYGCIDEHYCKCNNITPDENYECYYADDLCPICRNPMNSHCQCRFKKIEAGYSKDKEIVALDHLYLFNEKQLNHLMWLQRQWKTNYIDYNKQQLWEELKRTW